MELRSKYTVAARLRLATCAAALALSACAGEARPAAGVAPAGTGAPRAGGRADAEREIRAAIARYGAAANARDLRAAMRGYVASDHLLVYDVSDTPFRGVADVTRDWAQFFAAMRAIDLAFRDIEVTVDAAGEFAYATFIERASLTPVHGTPLVVDDLRTTQIYQKLGGQWLIVHEHKSKSRTD